MIELYIVGVIIFIAIIVVVVRAVETNGHDIRLVQIGSKALDKIMYSSKTLSYDEYLDNIDKMDKSVLQEKIKDGMVAWGYLSFNQIDRVIANLREEREQYKRNIERWDRARKKYDAEEQKLKESI